MTGVSYKTQYSMVKRWVQRGFKVVSLLCLRGSKVKLDEATRATIASPAMLMAQRHMSLQQRANYWREKLGLAKLSTWLIREIYLENGASYRKPKVVYKSKNERVEELRHKQKEFSTTITRVIMSEPNTDIVYIDETTFHLWMSPPRVWIKPGMRVEMPDQRGQSISVIGGLSLKHGLISISIFAGSNNVSTFSPFI